MILARRVFLAALACAAVVVFPSVASAATTIGTAPPGSQFQCQWGAPNTATYGETILAPQADNVLDSFTFYVTAFRDPITGVAAPADIVYKAYVYEFSGGKAIGAPIWQSASPQTVSTTTASQAVTAQTGGVALTPGSQYVLFLSVSETFELNGAGSIACWMFPGSLPHYDDGNFVFLNNGGDETKWTTQTWTATSTDVAFTASFSGSDPGPEPIYTFDGFYEPVLNRDETGAFVLNAVQAGQAIPIRFSLGGDHGLDVMAAGFPKSEAIACDSQAEVNGIDQTVNAGSSSLSYAAGSDTYTYVWKTDRSWADTCRQFVLKLDDGTTARANFMFR